MNKNNRRNLFILSFTLLVVMLGYGMAMPIMPFYIEHFGAGGTELGWLMSTYSGANSFSNGLLFSGQQSENRL